MARTSLILALALLLAQFCAAEVLLLKDKTCLAGVRVIGIHEEDVEFAVGDQTFAFPKLYIAGILEAVPAGEGYRELKSFEESGYFQKPVPVQAGSATVPAQAGPPKLISFYRTSGFGGYQYYLNHKKITWNELCADMHGVPPALNELKASKSSTDLSEVFLVIGGIGLGWLIADLATGTNAYTVPSTVTAVAGLTAGLVFLNISGQQFENSRKLYREYQLKKTGEALNFKLVLNPGGVAARVEY